MRTALGIVMVAGLSSAGCSDDGESAALPEPPIPESVVNEQHSQDGAVADEVFVAEEVTHFRSGDVLSDLDVRRVALSGSEVFVGTASGVARLDGAGFVDVSLPGAGAVVDLAVMADRLVVARADEVQLLTSAGAADQQWAVNGVTVSAVAAHGGQVFCGTEQGLFTVDQNGAAPVAAAQGFAVRDLAVSGDVLWMATAQGLERYDAAADMLLAALRAPSSLPDDDVRAVSAAQDGTLVAGSALGTARISADGSSAEVMVAELDGLPNGGVLAVAADSDAILSGHTVGATWMGDGHKDHYSSLRWTLDGSIVDVALAADGTRWLASSAGISRIALADDTLADKAARFESLTDRHWRMDGFVADNAVYDDPWDQGSAPQLNDKDNDGLWTEMQIAAWCFAYGATGEISYYDKARRAMDVMQLQIDVPAATFEERGMAPGFITRSLVRSDEGALFSGKESQDNWHLQELDGKTYYWKDDTSSDEYVGHFFGIPLFYDLCAQSESERDAIASRVDSVMRYIVDNGYHLIDLDGQPTEHGHWEDRAGAIDSIAECTGSGRDHCGESFAGEGWLGSIEMLGMLLASWHITGNPLYYQHYERLAGSERYAEMVRLRATTLNVTLRGSANHSDHELATLAYFTLLRYEPNAERRAIYLESIRDFYEYERPERNPLEIAVMASALGDAEIAAAVRTLREMPNDWREWLVDNSHRRDVELDVPDRFDEPQFKTVLPYDEIRTMKWNGNPYVVSKGGDGRAVQAPWPYLLPYWMLRYYGALE